MTLGWQMGVVQVRPKIAGLFHAIGKGDVGVRLTNVGSWLFRVCFRG